MRPEGGSRSAEVEGRHWWSIQPRLRAWQWVIPEVDVDKTQRKETPGDSGKLRNVLPFAIPERRVIRTNQPRVRRLESRRYQRYIANEDQRYWLRLERIDPGGAISSVIEADRVLGSIVYFATEVSEPGVVRHIEGNRQRLGVGPGQPALDEFHRLGRRRSSGEHGPHVPTII